MSVSFSPRRLADITSVLPGVGRRDPLNAKKSPSFKLDAYLASLQTGFRLNTRKTDRFFQEATGPTLADDVGEAAALALDSETWGGKTLAQVIASQPELVVNGDGTSLSGWTVGLSTDASSVGGRLRVVNTSPGNTVAGRISQNVPCVVGRMYRVEIEVLAAPDLPRVAINANSSNFGGALIDIMGVSSGVLVRYFVATNALMTVVAGLAGATLGAAAEFDKISVKEVPGNYALQTGASTLRPQRQATGFKFDGLDDNWLANYLPRVDLAAALSVNGGFDTDTLWIKGTGWSIGGGVATKAAGTASNLGSTFGALPAGKLYACTYTLTRSAGSAVFFIGANVGPTRSASGTYTDVILSPGAGFGVYGDAAFAGTIDNVVVREITSQTQFFAALVEVPASIAANQVVVGSDTTTNTRLYVGFNSSGSLLYAVGNNAYSHIVDYRGQTVFVMLAFDGTTVRLFVNDQLVATQVQAGAPNPNTPVRIGAANQAGSPSTYFGGVLIDTCAGADFPDLPRALQVRSAMLAGQ